MTALGINLRNAIISRSNPRPSIRLVNDKYGTKVALAEARVPVPGTIALLQTPADLRAFDWEVLPDAWALKPNRGRRGEGILLAAARDGEGWTTASGRKLGRDAIRFHIERILDGEYSLEGLDRDSAMFEPLIIPHPLLKEIVPEGLPDTRVICHGDEPIMAMMRIPTRASDGKANLHQGAIGAGIDMETGLIFRAVLGDQQVTHHPDTGYALIGLQVPQWDEVLAASTKCGDALGLGYSGADIVLDAERGPLVLECNAFPGLAIQNVNARGLKGRIDDLGLGRPRFWSRFRRAPRAHPHVITAERNLLRLGPRPLHPGFSSIEQVLSESGDNPFNMFAGFEAFYATADVDPDLGRRAEEALRSGQWVERGVGEHNSLILTTTTDPALVVIGRILRSDDGRPRFEICHAAEVKGAGLATEGDNRRRLLVVDDDELLLDFLRYELERENFSVVTARDGHEALQRLKVVQPSAIILDGDMPGLDGLEVLRQVRAHSVMGKIPVIMLTARRQNEQIVTALELGADTYVTKPFRPEELIARLERLLGPRSAD